VVINTKVTYERLQCLKRVDEPKIGFQVSCLSIRCVSNE